MKVLMGGGGSSGGSISGGSGSSSTVVSKQEVVEPEKQLNNNNNNNNMVVGIEGSDESELELGLGLSLGVLSSSNSKNLKQVPRILTAKDLPSLVSRPVLPPSPSSASSCSSLGLSTLSGSGNSTPNISSNVNNTTNGVGVGGNNVSAGTKRAASPTGASQVVGWPPIRAYRMNSMANQAKSIATGEHSSQFHEGKGKDGVYGSDDKVDGTPKDRIPLTSSLFVKVNMDGAAIGRKVDLNSHSGYESLARTLEDMFINKAVKKSSQNELDLMPKVTRPSKLLDGTSDYVLTYEDKDGDWMLVGDVPWGMFLNTVKRLRIMRTSEANGLAPRLEERSTKQKSRPI